MGKSSLVNSLLGESVVRVQAFKLQVCGARARAESVWGCGYARVMGTSLGQGDERCRSGSAAGAACAVACI